MRPLHKIGWLLVGIAIWLYIGLALSALWAWFIAPLGAHAISVPQGCGIVVAVRMLQFGYKADREPLTNEYCSVRMRFQAVNISLAILVGAAMRCLMVVTQ